MDLTLILSYFPIIFVLYFSLRSSNKYHLTKVSSVLILVFVLIAIYTIAYYPEELTYDKPRYTNMYNNVLKYGEHEFRDPGWIAYNKICVYLFGENIDYFYLLTAAIYVGTFFWIGFLLFSKDTMGYFVVMTVGCLGFMNYGTNVIRAGTALSIVLIAVSLKSRLIFKLLFLVIAFSFQKSVIIPVVAYLGARYLKPVWGALALWVICLLLSIANLDIGPLFESFGFVDERVVKYANTINSLGGHYEKSFRWDFLIYSFAPILIAQYFIVNKKILDKFYLQLVKTYILANAVWLLAIRMAYTDRLAYLSWFLIPLVTLYPVLKYPNKFMHPQRIVVSLMLIFLGVKIILSIK